ncbi:hypothetical protein GS429_20650 [Natronorubrum sp. JWXQ-INN-674]|uniref:Uncharacterized protein n=1 Tax=Natronorubrum halalkaliphilum TaxID=2691917 RepID=A0A6B0VTE6_9EURY|nr:hypothetical protein [Natronorubrum halalkaliphilum]MXV64433.1 hypothetical protein [Natronorubrum halalkaliphilum]
MISVIIYTDPFDGPTEVARVTIEGEVIRDGPTADRIRTRLKDDLDPINRHCTDGRDLLRYIKGSYSSGYKIALYDSEDSAEIIEGFSDEEYEEWNESTEYDTSL